MKELSEARQTPHPGCYYRNYPYALVFLDVCFLRHRICFQRKKLSGILAAGFATKESKNVSLF
jgi:hypothetical protein